jgi:site-specific DNA-methyltransferase (adenine-specific)
MGRAVSSDWTLHLGDCLEGMATLADKSVDHCITDPPFTQKTSEGARNSGASGRVIDFDGIDGQEAGIMRCALKLSRRWTIIACAFEQLGIYSAAAGDRWVRSGVWHKPDATPQFTGDRPAMCGEAFAIAHAEGKKRWNGKGRPAFWSFLTERDRHGHPTPKPIGLMEALIADFTDPGDLILDPFAGSGTTGVAAIRLGRRFIGWEKDPKYHAIAMKRLEAAREQITLFPAKPPKMKQAKLL